jgi:hypothetical protein
VSVLLITSAARIAREIGEGKNDIPRLVEKEGLPAWKKRGKWRALPDELADWLREQRKKHCKQ